VRKSNHGGMVGEIERRRLRLLRDAGIAGHAPEFRRERARASFREGACSRPPEPRRFMQCRVARGVSRVISTRGALMGTAAPVSTS
jgi:hypothetical protein